MASTTSQFRKWSADVDSTYEQTLAALTTTTAKLPETPATTEGGESKKPLTRKVSWGGSRLQAPQRMPTVSGATPTGARFNKATSARLILLALGLAGFSIIFAGRGRKAYTTTVTGSDGKPKQVSVPGNLHAFGGLVIAGTIALIVNEISAELGIVFAVGLGYLALHDAVGDKNTPGTFASWGEQVFGSAPATAAPPKPAPPKTIPRSLPGNQALPPSASLPGGGMYGNLSG